MSENEKSVMLDKDDPYKGNKMFDEKIINKIIDEAPEIKDITEDINGEEIEHVKNSKLKKRGVKVNYSEAHIQEILKCKNDIHYFANNYFYITSLDKGLIKIPLRKYQKQMIHNIQNERFNIINASRQSGKCTSYNSVITYKNNLNQEFKIKIGDFYSKLKNENFFIRCFTFLKNNVILLLSIITKKIINKIEGRK